jgi:hypothetical protein
MNKFTNEANQMVNLFSLLENETGKQQVIRGANVLKKEAVANGYKITPLGLTCFLDACEDRLGTEKTNFYRLCILYAAENEAVNE